MSAKEVKFHGDARDRMLRGVDILANAVLKRVGRIERMGSAAWLADHHQRFANEMPAQSVNRGN